MSDRVAVFMGTRPEAIKMAPVVRALADHAQLEPVVVSTGQHREMLAQVVDLFDLQVDHELEVMTPGQTLASLSARLITRIDAFLDQNAPDLALVQGDTTTVLMAALACFYRGIPVGHVEAGLRTGDIRSPFPEEANRRLVTPLAELHFAPTMWSARQLLAEGVPKDRVQVTGNTVIDALSLERTRQQDPNIAASVDAELEQYLGAGWRGRSYVLVTGHRRENFGERFEAICTALCALSDRFPECDFVYPVHLNPRVKEPVERRLGGAHNIKLLPPLSYRPFVGLMSHARLVLTDSGGVQEEAPGLGKPVLVMRDTTERPEGVAAGTVRLVGADTQAIVHGVSELLRDETAYRRMAEAVNPYGDGQAAPRVAAAVASFLAQREQTTAARRAA
ncbi:MAG: UDP-N-acetylglucosamine 2-epimerase (non-hydrolyzing) [Myxococcales bacterium FL481]|nr:MAG: UDP-N-acetylglucosamine 2-epimerase (non-hydrolyzing) [Myxococcales bacterium FL481]